MSKSLQRSDRPPILCRGSPRRLGLILFPDEQRLYRRSVLPRQRCESEYRSSWLRSLASLPPQYRPPLHQRQEAAASRLPVQASTKLQDFSAWFAPSKVLPQKPAAPTTVRIIPSLLL